MDMSNKIYDLASSLPLQVPWHIRDIFQTLWKGWPHTNNFLSTQLINSYLYFVLSIAV